VTATDFRTGWEAAQYAADHGAGAAIGQGLRALGSLLCEHGARDAALLGIGRLPGPPAFLVPVMDGTEDERRARVDAFAAAHGVTARWHGATRTYRAKVMFGPVAYIALTRPEADRDLNEDLAVRRLEELREELRAGRHEDQAAQVTAA
jgi:hypothetical protein